MIDLGQKSPSGCAPCSPCSEPANKPCYPTFYFTANEECDIPDEGTAVIKFRKLECAENTRDPEDPKYRYELEVQGIEVKAASKKDAPDMGGAFKKGLDRGMKEKGYPEGEED